MYEYLLSPIWEKFSLPYFIDSFFILVGIFVVVFVIFLAYALKIINEYKFKSNRKIWLKVINDLSELDLTKSRSEFWWEYNSILRDYLSIFKNQKAKSAILIDLKKILSGSKISEYIDVTYGLSYSEEFTDTKKIRREILAKTQKYIKSKIVLW